MRGFLYVGQPCQSTAWAVPPHVDGIAGVEAKIDANEIMVDSGVGMEAVGSIKIEMTERTTARNPYEALLSIE